MEKTGNNVQQKFCNHKYSCNICHYYTSRKSSYDDHLLSLRHLKIAESVLEFCNDTYTCTKCNYNTSRKSNFEEHLLTSKHQNSAIIAEKMQKTSNKSYDCDTCGKKYKVLSGLWKHKKKCTNEENISNKDLVIMLLKENNELKQMMLETMKSDKNVINSNNNNNVNSHNKTFNLQFFLNETCKDAMNITDFVDSIKLQLSDLENVGRLGYVNGISKIIIKNLNALDETKRPIHCTDTKREILYVKDEDIWKKDNDNDKICIKKAIKRVAYKNCKLIPEFREKHPDCNKSDSRYSDQYNKMIVEAMGGSGDNDCEKEDKIIQNISKEVPIKKNNYLCY